MIVGRRTPRTAATLVHVQAAMAIGAIVIASVATSLATLYRLQTAADELRERNAVAYRFERQFRADARAADACTKTAEGLTFQLDGGESVYQFAEGQLIRTLKRDAKTARDVMYLPEGLLATVDVDEDAKLVELSIQPDPKAKQPVGATLPRRIRATIGRTGYVFKEAGE